VDQSLRLSVSPDLVRMTHRRGTAVYHRTLGGLVVLDAAAEQVLDAFGAGAGVGEVVQAAVAGGRADPARCERLVEQLALRGFLDQGGPPAPPAPNRRVNVVQLVLVNGCNFGCTYCFEGIQGSDLTKASAEPKRQPTPVTIGSAPEPAGERVAVDLLDPVYVSEERYRFQRDPHNRTMAPEAAVAYTRQALAVARSEGVDQVMVQFFGGEPLMNKPACLAVLEQIGPGRDEGVAVQYTVVTNGSLVTDEIAEAFARHRVGVCVSFDAPKSGARPLKNGRSSEPLVLAGLRRLRDHGCRVAINTALCSSTFDDVDESLVDFAVEMGVGEIGIVLDLDPGFYAEYGGDRIAARLMDLVVYGREHGVVVTGYWHQIFQLLAGFDVVAERGFKNCSAKGAQFSIEPNGEVFSCKAGSGHFGNIEQGRALLSTPGYTAHAALRYDNPEYCRGCAIEGFCGGLCLGPLEKQHLTIDAVEIPACDTYRAVTERLIQQYEEIPALLLAAGAPGGS
jgi:uncharacterized protein